MEGRLNHDAQLLYRLQRLDHSHDGQGEGVGERIVYLKYKGTLVLFQGMSAVISAIYDSE
jgi:hypothetical protein